MSELERMRRVIALNHVEAKGDALTRELVDTLRDDRAVVLRENQSLHGEMSALRNDVIDAHRSGLSPGARHVVGRIVAALVVLSSVTALTLWFAGVGPVSRALRGSVAADAVPVRAGPSWVGPVMSFTALGPPELINAVTNKFKIMPTEIDTGIGTRLSVRYVDGPYSRLEGDEQRAQTLAVARFVWELKGRPKGMEMITVRVERPVRAPGDVGVMTDLIFLPAELNGR